MKRFLAILGTALFASNMAFAEIATLIDFSQLVGEGDNVEHAPTLIDYSKQAGTSFTAADKDIMKVSLALENWEVELASSARTTTNQSNSYVLKAMVSGDASKPDYAGKPVLGVRVHFPEFGIHSSATVKPPITIPAYSTLEGDQAKIGGQFDGYGVVKNVGVLKSIQINLLGQQFPNGLSIILEDEKGVESTIFMGYMRFDGWKSLVWDNPEYQVDVRKRDIRQEPLYPRSQPFLKFKGLVIHRDAAQEGGDVITYFKDIKIIFDKAVLDRKSDIDHELTWQILAKQEESRRNFELSRLGSLQVLRRLEKEKMADPKLKFPEDEETAEPAPAPATN